MCFNGLFFAIWIYGIDIYKSRVPNGRNTMCAKPTVLHNSLSY